MALVSTLAAVIVGAAFVVAGATKLASPERWPLEAAGLGAPRWTVPIVPWVELALGALLIVQWYRRGAAIAAATLLVVFTAMILAKLRVGERPTCACFGALSQRPIGGGHIARNGALLVAAAVAAL